MYLAGAYYFFFLGALGALLPFLPLLLKSHGLSGWDIGLMMALFPLFRILSPPVWGIIADLWGRRRLLLQTATFAGGIAVLGLSWATTFSQLLLVMAVYCMFIAPVMPLADAATRVLLNNDGSQFGRVRLWGSVGFCVTALTVGQLGPIGDGHWLVGLASLFLISAGLVSLRFPDPPQVVTAKFSQALDAAQTNDLPVLFMAIAVYYSAHTFYDGYLSLYLASLGASASTISFAWVLGTGAEVVMMIYSPKIFKRVSSLKLLTFCSVIAAVRWLSLSFITHIPVLLMLQPLHAVTFGLWYLSMVDQVQSRAPNNLRSALQGLASASMGMGMLVGFIGGGWLYTKGGGQPLFGIGVFIALSSILILRQIRK